MRVVAPHRPGTPRRSTLLDAAGSSFVVVLAACNAISGIGDLTTEKDPSPATSSGSSGSTSSGGGGTSSGWPDFDSGFPPGWPIPGGDCRVDGQTVANGESVTLYSAEKDSACVTKSGVRPCRDGILLGDTSYRYATCSAPTDCDFDGQTVADGETVTAYEFRAYNGASCGSGECFDTKRVCTDGKLSGGGSKPSFRTCAAAIASQPNSQASCPESCNGFTAAQCGGSSWSFMKSGGSPTAADCKEYCKKVRGTSCCWWNEVNCWATNGTATGTGTNKAACQ